VLLATTLVVVLAAFFLPPIPQPADYHNFADRRGWLDIPNFGDVASNFGFAVVGLWGLVLLARLRTGAPSFVDPRERYPYILVFLGVLLTAFGSAYYHLAPDNRRLAWDRLPMTIVFTSIVAALIAERISLRAGLRLLVPLIAIGVTSVLHWRASELRGAGDLRFYAAVQAYAFLILPLVLLLFPARYTRSRDWMVMAALYVLAKILELLDQPVFGLGHAVSGLSVKHLAAGLASYWILRMLMKRRPLLPA